jgi:hypothetical protein
MTVTAQELIEHIKKQNPIRNIYRDDIKTCIFCDIDWAEATYEQYEENRDLEIETDEHHKEDCIWILAHEVK